MQGSGFTQAVAMIDTREEVVHHDRLPLSVFAQPHPVDPSFRPLAQSVRRDVSGAAGVGRRGALRVEVRVRVRVRGLGLGLGLGLEGSGSG